MSRIDAINEYRLAQRAGLKYYNACVAAHKNPYPEVLEDQINETQASGHAPIGTIEIPSDLIVGTLAAGRKMAFAGNYMPILPENSEFASKWISLCDAHMSEEGIRDPITCMEFMGKFYVMEGHKRVSVLKSFGAPAILGTVTRMIPVWSQDPAVQAYYEFMKFYRLCGLYHIQFSRPGQYDKLQQALGFAADHVWTREEKADFLSVYWRFRSVCDENVLDKVRDHSIGEALLMCLEVYSYDELRQDDSDAMRKKLMSLLPDLQFSAQDESATVSMNPVVSEKSFVRSLLDGISRPVLNVAFVHAAPPESSAWSLGHEQGAKRLKEVLGDQVSVTSYVANDETADEVMEQAVQAGAQVLFVTAPILLAPARRAAALHPDCKVLVCALSVPFTGIRTYYCRLYEAKFISGAIAGVLCEGEPIGFLARYPILGSPAAINAFALGARMTRPDAKIQLAWSCLPGDPIKALNQAGCKIVSGHTMAVFNSETSSYWNTAHMGPDGKSQVLISDVWNWGRLYEDIVRSILNGGWEKAEESSPAVHYWWGMNSGVMDVQLSPTLPAGVMQLATILKDGLVRGSLHPFLAQIRDQQGVLRSAGDRWFTPMEMMNMNWLCDNVVGKIPAQDELLEMSRKTTSLLAIPTETGKE